MSSKAMESMNLSEYQTKVLEENFKLSKHPDDTDVMLIAAESGLSEADTQKWFTLRTAEWRKAEGLPAEQGSVLD
ncbi:homeodomain-only protein [Synchiropus splendidus]|uniref:homeodomain-only protein n=1 Tax=Synchiropus splendidus TaxID=270530 RepID=UPI00237EC033|nr:homeodomain-only protein [Synchiropus splendidus]